MAQKRSLPDASELSSKVPKVEEFNVEYLLPIEFVSKGSSPCITHMIANLFRVKDRRVKYCQSGILNNFSISSTLFTYFVIKWL